MIQKVEKTRLEIIEKIVAMMKDKLKANEVPILEEFAHLYYSNASLDDLCSRTILDLYGALVSHWHYLSLRKPLEQRVRVYNPQFEEHGWQSTHTVVEIVHTDLPFLIDSVRMELNRKGINVHFALSLSGLILQRNKQNDVVEIKKIIPKENVDQTPETSIFIEIDHQSDPEFLSSIKEGLSKVLNDVCLAVEDWKPMQSKMLEAIKIVSERSSKHETDLKEKVKFLEWINSNNFTYLGYGKFSLVEKKHGKVWALEKGSGLGVLRDKVELFRKINDFPPQAQELFVSNESLLIGKTSTPATVHRPVNTDFILVKIFNEKQKVIGEHRFIGLYAASAYNWSPLSIPFINVKVDRTLKKANISPRSHEGKSLINIIENLPRDDVFQATDEELYYLATGIHHLQERQKIRLFVRKDTFGRFYSCLVFVPRDRFNSQLRQKMQNILQSAFNGYEASFITRFSESILARIHFIIRVKHESEVQFDVKEVEKKLIEASRTWEDNLKDALLEYFGEEKGNRLFARFKDAFPAGYKVQFEARTAVFDIQHIETLCESKNIDMSFYQPLEEPEDILRFKLFQPGNSIPLSEVIPMLECMGLCVNSERPHEIIDSNGFTVWINDFRMTYDQGHGLDAKEVKEIFQEAFYKIWHGKAESDGFNRLVLGAGLNWHEITMLRAYAKYCWQIGFTFSQKYVEDALAENPIISQKLVELFKIRFSPDTPQKLKNERANELRREIKADLEHVANLDTDRILRRYVDVILGTLRTNFFKCDEKQEPLEYLSFKLDPNTIPEMPLPKPMFEIFVYSPRVEGVHLRGAKVARGGLRWSDRREDFRTEVLGLMKAQQVKNAVIVPLGAKGGFVPKLLPQGGSREEIMAEGISCYKTFIQGLLDITDNLVDGDVVPPAQVVRYDADDPYLVVAADKGTATFSDIANEIAINYEFWLGDAFASGGSVGYDHKKMGITAKGAWESVKRHFREMGTDCQNEPFTCVGIGDMSGDVFGNGMLLSTCTQLVGAFNHLHIFIDPTPNAKTSYQERKRLFALPRSSWLDYNQKLISQGGGVFSRSAKSITITPQMKKIFGIVKDKMVPNELIRAMLKSEVDLIWNGGIGTYVKASFEHNSEVGDRVNDALRINGEDLKCKIVGEGGNLGFTQLGRVEFALAGGRINTDAIDNSAGVDCSDHEVNIKILLNSIVCNGDMTEKQRNALLAKMTDEVEELVLENNRGQIGAISIAAYRSFRNVDMHARLIHYLEKMAKLDRELEFLPSQQELDSRKQNQKGLTRPELSVLLAYSKTYLKEELLASNLLEDPYIENELALPFPRILQDQYAKAMRNHRLRREIIAMQVANSTINDMGLGFLHRLQDETGATASDIVRGYVCARDIFEADILRKQIDDLNFKVPAEIQIIMNHELNRLLRRATRWLLRHRRSGLEIVQTINHFAPKVKEIAERLKVALHGRAEEYLVSFAKNLMSHNVGEDFAYKISSMNLLLSALDIIEASTWHNFSVEKMIEIYYAVGLRLEFSWFKEQIKEHPVNNHWEALARASFRDDLDRQQRALSEGIMLMPGDMDDVDAKIDAWMEKHKVLVERWKNIINDLKSVRQRDFVMYSVALRDLLDLAQASKVDYCPMPNVKKSA